MRLEHIGIAVADAQKAQNLFDRLLGKPVYQEETVDTEKVTTYFYDAGTAKLELLTASEEASVINKFIEKRGEGVHHLAFEVDNINEEIERLKGEGFVFINEKPKPGADNKIVCFLHPKSTNGVLVELCQSVSTS
ncbi:methylmalonyl-CoA epimerase [Tunicatimonas pelagia]|uniref:methylmalonyl-CoA epimerase n=1 Tax=Tunicatimonas pelagia TaxID=931531 RepID=UPI0026660280|nr:methylmalonyl-CoA epimerase [Tunicatimonas pelagia]WKN42813.1 methylmalonyl-CoA epimerase [Tunicatimonas pelagia]